MGWWERITSRADASASIARGVADQGGEAAVLPATATCVDDEGGSLLRIAWESAIPSGAVALVGFRSSPAGAPLLSAVELFAGPGGDFLAVAPIEGATCVLFLPTGAVLAESRRVRLDVTVAVPEPHGTARVVGRSVAELDLPPAGRYCRVSHLLPVIDLGLAVARADGSLDAAELGRVREWLRDAFALGEDEEAALVRALERSTGAQVEDLVDDSLLRLPGLSGEILLEHAADIAAANGVVHEAELDCLRRIFAASGAPPSAWEDCRARLGLEDTAADDGDAFSRHEEPRLEDWA